MQPFPFSRSSLSQHNILGNHLRVSRHAAISTHAMIHEHATQACAWQRPLCVFWAGSKYQGLSWFFSSGVWSLGSVRRTIFQLRISVRCSYLTSLRSSRRFLSPMQSWLGTPTKASSDFLAAWKRPPCHDQANGGFTRADWASAFSEWLGILSTGSSRLSTSIKPLKSQAGNQENIKDEGYFEWNDITFLILIVLYSKTGHWCCYKL